ncbi:MAG TPA: archaeosortase/exosortase family protein [Candidatus Polarisedimenticolaceae bacterium]|nr:archaeosortase/exosortase family protein [Candidatus Polarisedimenticolaceae bacterium]
MHRPSDGVIRFCATFAGLQVVAQAGYYGFFLKSRLFPAYLHLLAESAAILLRLVGRTVTCEFDTLHGGFEMSIRTGCDGIQAIAILATAVLAFPSSWRRRAQGILAGVILLLGINILRIATLFVVGTDWPQHFQSFHVEVWPALLILCTALLWVAWASTLAAPRRLA